MTVKEYNRSVEEYADSVFRFIHQLCKTKKEEYGEREHKNRRNRGL